MDCDAMHFCPNVPMHIRKSDDAISCNSMQVDDPNKRHVVIPKKQTPIHSKVNELKEHFTNESSENLWIIMILIGLIIYISKK